MTIRLYADGDPERRALEAWRVASDGTYKLLDLHTLHRLQRGVCYLCIVRFKAGPRSREPMGWSRDHVFPQNAGGGALSNLLLAHRLCNTDKAKRWPTPCEVIYLAGIYAAPHDAPAARAARRAAAIARGERRRAYMGIT